MLFLFVQLVDVDSPFSRFNCDSVTVQSVLLTFAVKANSGSVQAVASKKSFVTPSLVTPTHPEEDILFQWRLRRKIEQARECPQPRQHPHPHGPSFSWEVPSFSLPSASGQAYKVGVIVYC